MLSLEHGWNPGLLTQPRTFCYNTKQKQTQYKILKPNSQSNTTWSQSKHGVSIIHPELKGISEEQTINMKFSLCDFSNEFQNS